MSLLGEDRLRPYAEHQKAYVMTTHKAYQLAPPGSSVDQPWTQHGSNRQLGIPDGSPAKLSYPQNTYTVSAKHIHGIRKNTYCFSTIRKTHIWYPQNTYKVPAKHIGDEDKYEKHKSSI